jgi:uncharacterized protein (UPF0210 family)
LANKTFTAGEVLTASDTNEYLNNYRADLVSPSELTVISAIAATGTVDVDIADTSVTYYTTDASANFTLNFRGNATTTAASYIQTNEAVTHVFLNTNGATPYYPTAFQIDGAAGTPIFQGGAAFSAGNADSVDAYSFTIIKTASTPTYKILASQTQFA